MIEPRYYGFNVYSHRKTTEKLRYIHRNPVTRGLVANPEDWPWSSYALGIAGTVEIESFRTAWKRGHRTLFELKGPDKNVTR